MLIKLCQYQIMNDEWIVFWVSIWKHDTLVTVKEISMKLSFVTKEHGNVIIKRTFHAFHIFQSNHKEIFVSQCFSSTIPYESSRGKTRHFTKYTHVVVRPVFCYTSKTDRVANIRISHDIDFFFVIKRSLYMNSEWSQ